MGNTKSMTGVPPAAAAGSSSAIVVAPPKIVKGGDHDMPLWALAVSEYLPWETRHEVMFLSKSWYRNTTTLAYYRFLCQRLAHECGVYIPVTPPAGDTWRTLFYDLYHLRNLWKAKPLEIIGTTQKEHAKRSKISVYAKFRPNKQAISDKKDAESQRNAADNDQRREAGVTLPLHQKLAMIRMSHNIKSNRRALRLLTEEGSWFSAKWEALSEEMATANELTVKDVATNGHGDAENDENSPHNTPSSSSSSGPAASFTTREGRSQNRRLLALTAARRRAAADEMGGHGSDALQARRKEQQQMVSKVHSLDALSGRVVMLTPDVGLREFIFDGVLTGTSSQSYAYELCTKRLIMDLLNGFNATAIVYGQTGSGKTYSMFGKDEASAMGRDKDGKGIIPRACEELLQAVEQRQRYNGIESELYVSYVEVFGDQVSDLLRQGQRCGHSKVAAQRYVLNGAAEYRVTSMGDFEHVLRIGEQQKRRAATAMNDRSTRAHSLFIVTLKQRKAPMLIIPNATTSATATATATATLPVGVGEDVTLTTRLFLADLGGSEQVKKSQVEAGQHRVIERDATTSTDGGTATATATATFSVGFQKAERMREAVNINLGLLALKKCIEALNQQSPYVPYQDSKLTMLLSEGLGGNCKTSIIVCANMDTTHASETVASLRFGERCARIETAARNNATILAGILADLDARIMELEQTILQKERWEVREVRREDVLAEDGTLEKALGGQEIIKQTVVVGAEQERIQLVQLLLQRQQFAGIRREAGDGDNDEALWGDDDVDVDSAALEAATSAAAAAGASESTSTKNQRRKKVLGFGRAAAAVYGFGDTYDENAELVEENDRFTAQTSTEALPKVLRRARRGVAWAQGGMDIPTVDSESFQKEVRKANKIRAKLAYSGISA